MLILQDLVSNTISLKCTICLNHFAFGQMRLLLVLGTCKVVLLTRTLIVLKLKVLLHVNASNNVLQVQPSPTTGKFQFASGIESRNSTFMMEDPDKRKENALESINSSSFSFKPVPETASSLFPGATSRVITHSHNSHIHSHALCTDFLPVSNF